MGIKKKKSRADRLFYIFGTLMLTITMSIVAFNFLRDSRFLEGSLMEAFNGNSAGMEGKQQQKPDDEYTTVKYEKEKPAVKTEQENKNDSGKKAADGDSTDKAEKIKVEILDYSVFEGLGEKMAKTLEASGYEVKLSKMEHENSEGTVIIEKSSKKAGSEILKIIGPWRIERALDDKSEYDVTIKLGVDYSP